MLDADEMGESVGDELKIDRGVGRLCEPARPRRASFEASHGREGARGGPAIVSH